MVAGDDISYSCEFLKCLWKVSRHCLVSSSEQHHSDSQQVLVLSTFAFYCCIFLHFSHLFLRSLKKHTARKDTPGFPSILILQVLKMRHMGWGRRNVRSAYEEGFHFPHFPSLTKLYPLWVWAPGNRRLWRQLIGVEFGDQLFPLHACASQSCDLTRLLQGGGLPFGSWQIQHLSTWWYVVRFLIPVIC